VIIIVQVFDVYVRRVMLEHDVNGVREKNSRRKIRK